MVWLIVLEGIGLVGFVVCAASGVLVRSLLSIMAGYWPAPVSFYIV